MDPVHVGHVGRYSVIRPLGQGGMGRVLLAKDGVLGRMVALKVLRDDLVLAPELRDKLFDRMRQEARAAAALAHPNMVTLHDMGEEEGVGLYLVFEYIEGPTLRERLAEAPLPPREVAAIARQLGSALTHAHEAQVIHRDVKPENVMLAGPTTAKLTDFGIARLPDSTLTRGGAVLGTPAYSAPEALAGADFSAASDQFALAATLYEALSGQRAFPGEDALVVATRVATGSAPPLPPLAGLHLPLVERVFARGMAKDKAKRYPSCADFGEALASALLLPPPTARDTPAPRSSVVPRATRRWQNMVAGAAVIVIAILVVLGRRATYSGLSLRDVAAAFASAVASGSTSAPPPSTGRARGEKPAAPSGSARAVDAGGAADAGLDAGGETHDAATSPAVDAAVTHPTDPADAAPAPPHAG